MKSKNRSFKDIDGIKFGGVKGDLIAARERIGQGNPRAAALHMKWAMEKLLPDGQQYCSQTLADTDPDKTIQGFLDNIVQALHERREPRPVFDGKPETPLLLPNDTKIRFCNGFHAMQKHLGNCDACCAYLYHGDGDLCQQGKAVICAEVAYSDTNPVLPT